MATKPDLGIKDPYALDETHSRPRSTCSRRRRPHQRVLVRLPEGGPGLQERLFDGRHHLAGHRQRRHRRERAPIDVVLPKEGSTGWSDTWMVAAKSAHKTCAYLFIDHIVSPKANAAIAEYFGEAPANKKACAETADKNHCTTFHADDEAYFEGATTGTRRSRPASTAAPTSSAPIRQVDQGLDRDPGHHESDGAGRAGTPGPATMRREDGAGRSARPAAALARVVYLGALGVISSRRSGRRTPSPIRWCRASRLENFAERHGHLPRIIGAHAADRRARHGDLRGHRGALRALHGPRRRAAVRRAARGAVLVPLWASYLVKAYAWRAMAQPAAVLEARSARPRATASPPCATRPTCGCPTWSCRSTRASSGCPKTPRRLGRPRRAGRRGPSGRVIVPALLPSVAAGSVFTFSLASATTSPCRSSAARPRCWAPPCCRTSLDLPFAAALGTVPVVVMVLYLLAVRRTGALDNL